MKYQPWLKVMADLPERKAHYTDAQFRAYVELLCAAAAAHEPGRFASIAAVRRVVGNVAHYLIEQGDLIVEESGECVVSGWEKYQRPFDNTHAERQSRYRQRQQDDGESDASSDLSLSRHNGSSTSTTTSTSLSTKTEDVPVAADFNDDWVWVSQLAEAKTGRAYALGAPTSKLGAMALAQVADFGRQAVDEAWSTVNSHRPNLNVMLAINQLVLGADNLLRPIPKVNGKQLAAEEQGKRDREAAEKRRAATRKLIDEQRAREH